MKKILEHIINNYGFSISKLRYTNEKFNLLKKLYNKYPKILKFLRILPPIKYNKTLSYFKNSIILQKQIYDGEGGVCSIIINPCDADECDHKDIKNIFVSNDDNYMVYIEFSSCCALIPNKNTDYYPFIRQFPLNNINGIKNIDLNFADIPELKQINRNIKINKLIN